MGVVIGWWVTIAVTAPPVYWAVMRRTGLSPWAYFLALWPAISACIVMVATILLARWFLQPFGYSLAVVFGIEVAIGGLAYCATVAIAYRRRLKDFISIIRSHDDEGA